MPNIEDLYIWISKNPSYEIIRSSVRQSVLSKENQCKGLTKSSSSVVGSTKTKISPKSVTTNQQKTTKLISKESVPIQRKKPTCSLTSDNNHGTTDIRSRVPASLCDKILMRLVKFLFLICLLLIKSNTFRLEKEDNNCFVKADIQIKVRQIEEEMFRVYGSTNNSYKNKFRSLLANINNMHNNVRECNENRPFFFIITIFFQFFYKQILSNELTAKEIVAMKAEDMLPPGKFIF